jgi:hypothetical protein
MKYNIYINQKELAKTELDLVDATILDYLYFLCNSIHYKIELERVNGYTWADYGKIIKDNPMLRIKSRGSITKRMQNLKDAGFIDTLEQRKNGHKFLYVKLLPRIDSLFIEINRGQEPIHQNEKPIHQKKKPIHQTEPIKTTTYNTTKDNTTTSNEVAKVIKLFEKIDVKNKTYYNHKTQRAKAQFLLDEHGYDKLAELVDIYLQFKDEKYLPSISSPYEMVEKWSKLGDFFRRKQADKNELAKKWIT